MILRLALHDYPVLQQEIELLGRAAIFYHQDKIRCVPIGIHEIAPSIYKDGSNKHLLVTDAVGNGLYIIQPHDQPLTMQKPVYISKFYNEYIKRFDPRNVQFALPKTTNLVLVHNRNSQSGEREVIEILCYTQANVIRSNNSSAGFAKIMYEQVLSKSPPS